MRHVTREEMQKIDRLAVEKHGISVDALMENAGRAVADVVSERISPTAPVIAVCGKGNNGGDGFVAARLLADRGYAVEVLALAPSYDPGTPTGRAWERARDHEGVDFVGRFKQHPNAVILDAIFGTGLARAVAGRERSLIEEMNRFDARWAPVVAVDIPSGLDANTGLPLGVAVKAAATVTMGLPKVGFRSPSAKPYVGELIVADIGFPPELLR